MRGSRSPRPQALLVDLSKAVGDHVLSGGRRTPVALARRWGRPSGTAGSRLQRVAQEQRLLAKYPVAGQLDDTDGSSPGWSSTTVAATSSTTTWPRRHYASACSGSAARGHVTIKLTNTRPRHGAAVYAAGTATRPRPGSRSARCDGCSWATTPPRAPTSTAPPWTASRPSWRQHRARTSGLHLRPGDRAADAKDVGPQGSRVPPRPRPSGDPRAAAGHSAVHTDRRSLVREVRNGSRKHLVARATLMSR